MAFSIEQTCEPIETTTAYSTWKIDPTWEHVDAAGHRHIVLGGDTPTLKTVTEQYWCEDCRDHHDIYRRICRICAEEIEPRTIVDKPASAWREYTQGLCRTTFIWDTDGTRRTFEAPDQDSAKALLAALAAGWSEELLVALVKADGWIAGWTNTLM